VSLSGYEEQASRVETADGTDTTITEDSDATTHTTSETSESYETPSAQHISTDSIQDLDLSNMTISPSKSSTPRPFRTQKAQQQQASFAHYPSPYETLRQEVNNTMADTTSLTRATEPETPGGRPVFPVDTVAATPQSSPFLPPRPTSIPRPSTTRKKTDPLLHRVLDRNYRVQATPLTTQRFSDIQLGPAATPSYAKRTGKPEFYESTLDSSPEVAPPELNHEIFSSPERKRPITGVSVLTPARARSNAQPPREATRTLGGWDSDDDDLDNDIPFGQSPPKTMQFHIPQNRLLKTPAKEASKRIVEDILTNAGIDYGEEELNFSQSLETEGSELDLGADPTSPSVVRRAMNIEDETF
jgi:DASH complex subunit ASK1